MAEITDTIENNRNGQRIHFLATAADTNGEKLEMACHSPAIRSVEPEHIHPKQTADFNVRSGHLGFRIRGEKSVIGPGESVSIPPGTPHQLWVVGDEPVEYLHELAPALNSEALFRTRFWLANAGHLNAHGLPGPFIMSELGLYFWDEIQVTRPHPLIQRIVYSAIWPFSTVFGYNAYVRQFG